MSQIFLKILNMSISASYIVLAVLLLRLLLRKAPKWISVVLWGIVAVRLICPFSMESVLSLIPSAETVSPDIMTEKIPAITSGISVVNSTINPIIRDSLAPSPGDSANPLQIWIPLLTAVWLVGMAAMLIYTGISYIRIKRRVGNAVLLRDTIYQSENVASPFVLGIVKPKIYLPFHMNEKDAGHVVAHEVAHIRRKDHLWKPLGFFVLSLHWFNPLMWLGYLLLCRDIELACDEKVIKELDRDARADYSQALLTCSVSRRMLAACPLAFGEVGVKNRVRSVLSYKKPAFWIILAAVVLCIAVAVCFLTDPKESRYGETDPNKLSEIQAALMATHPDYFGLDAANGLDVYVWQMAKHSYSFGLLPHSDQPREWISRELMDLRGASASDMRMILATYNIDEDNIYVIPWQNPVSSYIGDYWWVRADGQDTEAAKAAYVEKLRGMLFGVRPEQEPTAFVYALPARASLDEWSYLNIHTFGCNIKNVSIEFCGVRFENGHILFDIHWQNEGAFPIEIGPGFEVTRYDPPDLEALENKDTWSLYREMLAGSDIHAEGDSGGIGTVNEKTMSYNLSVHYDILAPGSYLFEVHGAWVEFSITSPTNAVTMPHYGSAILDIDGDGDDEICSLRPGYTSGLFTFIFAVQDRKTGLVEYETLFCSQVYDLCFQKGDDGITRVKAFTRDGTAETHLFDISIKDGHVNLTENGVPIGAIN